MTAAATAKTRPPNEMALPEAAPEDSGAPALVEALLLGEPEDAAPPEELGAALVPVGMVELTPGTMGVANEVGTMGVAVGTTTEGTTGDSETPGTTVGTTEGTSEGRAGTLVAGGAWIWPSLI